VVKAQRVHYLVQSSENMKIVKAKTTIENVFVVNQQFYVSIYLPGEQKQEQEVGLGCSKETCGRLITLFTTVFHVNDVFCRKKSKKMDVLNYIFTTLWYVTTKEEHLEENATFKYEYIVKKILTGYFLKLCVNFKCI